MRGRLSVLCLLPLVASCTGSVELAANTGTSSGGDGGTVTSGDDGSVDTAPAATCAPAITIDTKSPIYEARASTPGPAFTVHATDPGGATGMHASKLELVHNDLVVKSLSGTATLDANGLGDTALTWPLDSSTHLDPGAYFVRATINCPAGAPGTSKPVVVDQPFYVVRLGVRAIHVSGDARLPLMYHAVNKISGAYYPIPMDAPVASLAAASGDPDLETLDGKAKTFVAASTDVNGPPVDGTGAVIESGVTWPVSLTIGGTPTLGFDVGSTTASFDVTAGKPITTGIGFPGIPKLRLVVDGATPAADGTDAVVDGTTATFKPSASPAAAFGKSEWKLSWHFEQQAASGSWGPIPGAVDGTLTLPLYALFGNSIGTTAPNLPWVAVVDHVVSGIASTAPTSPAQARAALVKLINENEGLSYDRKSGASVYTDYVGSGGGWTAADFALAKFLGRDNGSIVNCSDCASILSTFANMIGAPLHYAIIGWNFPLNPIEGIGSTTFGSPFDSGRFAFNYHAVTTPDKSVTIDDATLAVNGGSDPTTAPYTRELVQNMSGTEYLKRLSPGTPGYQYADQVTTVH